jgi:hypothetical protein
VKFETEKKVLEQSLATTKTKISELENKNAMISTELERLHLLVR